MRISVLGPITVDGDAANLGPRDYVALAALTVRRGEVVSAETLADALWGERPPSSWSKVVQGCVVRLRKVLGAGAIETRSQGYCLVEPPDRIDSEQFERLVARGHELLTLGEPDRAVYVLGEALGLWRGRALLELEAWEPGRIAAGRLEEMRLDAEEARLDAALRAGRHREVSAEAQALAAEHPMREVRWTILARAQYQAGRQSDALHTLRQARTMLVRELGLDPGPGMVALEEAILRQDPTLLAASSLAGPADTCPYLGLVPYGVDDADAYFGRDADVAECLRRLASDGVLAVVGPSGSGKSSLVRAGIAAALARGGSHLAVVTPGAHPMAALTAVPASDPVPVLVVDQCEDAVTLCTDAEERARFFSSVAERVDLGPVVIALRADKLGDVSAHPAFARIVERGLYLLESMDDAALRAAIEGPARQAGLLCEPGLVDLLVRDVEGEPGALPLLSHALQQTWERREGRTLTVSGYQEIGGIRGAVAQSAERVYGQAPPEQRPALRDLLLRLVAPSPDGEPVRRRVSRRIVASGAEHERLIELLVGARLVTSDEDVVELAHEALARAWPRLRSWLDDDVEGQRILRHMSTAADDWDAMGRPDRELYRGVRLAQAIDWRGHDSPNLNPTERAFLDASRSVAESERNASRRRRRVVIASLAAGTAVATVLAAVAFVNQQRADDAAELARARELAAAAINVIDDDPSLSKLLAVASAAVGEPTLETISSLHRAWDADKVVARYTWPGDQTMFQLWTDLDPSHQWLVAAGMGDYVEVVDLTTGERLWSHLLGVDRTDGEQFEIVNPVFAQGGDVVVTGHKWFGPRGAAEVDAPSDLLGVHVWDSQSGELVQRIDVGSCGAHVVASSETRLLIKTLSGRPEERTCQWDASELPIELIDIRSGEREVLATRSPSIQHNSFWGGALSADGRYAAFDDLDAGEIGAAVVVDLSTGERLLQLERAADQEDWGVRNLNHDGSLLLYGDAPMQVWDVAGNEMIASFDEHESQFATFAADGSSVYSTGHDGTLRHWDATTGQELAVLRGGGDGPVSVVDDGLVLVPSFWAGEASLVDLRPKGEIGAVETCAGVMPANTLDVADGLAAFHLQCAGGAEGTTHVVSVPDHELLYTLPGHQAEALGISPDGTRFVRQEGEGTIHGSLTVRDLRTGGGDRGAGRLVHVGRRAARGSAGGLPGIS